MTRFARDRRIDARAQFTEEAPRTRRFERQLWRKLNEQHSELRAKPVDLRGKLIQYLWQRREFAFVCQRSWRFHCEAEVRRNAPCPTNVSLDAMMAMERAVDFHGVQSLRRSLQVRTVAPKQLLVARWDSPTGSTDSNDGRSHVSFTRIFGLRRASHGSSKPRSGATHGEAPRLLRKWAETLMSVQLKASYRTTSDGYLPFSPTPRYVGSVRKL